MLIIRKKHIIITWIRIISATPVILKVATQLRRQHMKLRTNKS